MVSSVRNSLILWCTLMQPSTHKSIPWGGVGEGEGGVEWVKERGGVGEGRRGAE